MRVRAAALCSSYGFIGCSLLCLNISGSLPVPQVPPFLAMLCVAMALTCHALGTGWSIKDPLKGPSGGCSPRSSTRRCLLGGGRVAEGAPGSKFETHPFLVGVDLDMDTSRLLHLHSHGVIHGDVKPENLLLGGDGLARLADLDAAVDLGSRAIKRP